MNAAEYVELHCHSYFSLLDGASSPEALVERAIALGYRALALTDHNGLYGAIRFWQAATERSIKPIIGAELVLADGQHLTLLAETQAGYANLSRLISQGQLAGQKKQPRLALADIDRHREGLICLSGCRQGAISTALLARDDKAAWAAASRLKEIFGQQLWIEMQRHYLPDDHRLIREQMDIAQRLGVGVVATNNVHYARRAGQRIHDVLSCIRQHINLPQALMQGLLHPNSERHLKSAQEMYSLFRELPQALSASLGIAERCNTCLNFVAQRLPDFATPPGTDAPGYLRMLCEEMLGLKFQPITPRARDQLAHELAVIQKAGLAGYFLIVWDIVRFARERGIRCQGRGSAANSLVAYLLNITPVDPLAHNLLFERFLSEGSNTMPDIDIDLAADRREEVIQYVYERYGKDYVAMVCNVVTYRARSAFRDVAKALAFPPDVIDQAARTINRHSEEIDSDLPTRLDTREASTLAPSLPWQVLSALLEEIEGVPRHLSIHVGGMLITASPLVEIVPIERATMPGRVVVQWDKDSVEDAGLIKIDLLSLRTLGMIEEVLNEIEQRQGVRPDLDHLSLDDPNIYRMLQRADTIGCFQVESRAQMQMLPIMCPDNFNDLVIEVSLVRPGPIQGNMVHPYLRRRRGLEPVEYAHPLLQPALEESLGIIIFQEQVIRVAVAGAGFTAAEADRLRRAISRSRSEEAIALLRQRFIDGARANGLTEETANDIFRQLAAFAAFGFCKSHAAAFALVAYQTLYLKAYYTPAFFCALLNHQPMGFYRPKVLIGDAKRHGVRILPPDVNHSNSKCTLEACPPSSTAPSGHALAIRLGLLYVQSVGEAWCSHIVEQRRTPYRDLNDFCKRTRLPRKMVENLIRAGALDSLRQPRRDLLWELGGLHYHEQELDIDIPIHRVALPELKHTERLGWEYELLGLAPGEHVMQLYRDRLRAAGVLSSAELDECRDGQAVRVAGMPVVRQRPPTAKGHAFITLEDEDGLMNLVIRPAVFEQYEQTIRNAPLLWAEGRLQREGLVTNIVVSRVAPLSAR